ncbi:MAG: Rossmann-like and DUF2520 domain-containing protein [Nitriliruptoraceae bacterium]
MTALRRAALVGPGRLGTLVALGLAAAGLRVERVAGGSDAARAALRAAVAGLRDVAVEEVAQGVDVVVLAVPDAAVAEIVDHLVRADARGEGQGVVHLSGALGLAPLRRAGLAGAWTAACHPAVTAPAGSTDPSALHGATWAVTAVPGARERAHEVVELLGGDPVDLAEADRPRYHAALAVASNAVGAAVVTARRLLGVAGVPDAARVLGPLAHASVDAALAGGAAALTGPVVRGDAGTVRAHLAAIGPDAPELAEAYRALMRAVLAVVRPGLDAAASDALVAALADPASDPAPDPEA